ncbi:hypothetical protein [Pilimelia terevasa]|nr:hypothetical protein [Pilimelia terevasa]
MAEQWQTGGSAAATPGITEIAPLPSLPLPTYRMIWTPARLVPQVAEL